MTHPPSCFARSRIGLSVAVLLATSCSDRALRPLNPCTTAGVSTRLEIDPPQSVDLLFMIDDSGSMREEQEKLRRELPRMVTALVTGDVDGDGRSDGPKVSSLRVGVVTSDMGVGGIGVDDPAQHGIASCGSNGVTTDFARAHFGDDGVLRRTAHDASVPGVPTGYDCDLDMDGVGDSVSASMLPDYLTFVAGGSTTVQDEFIRRVACLTNTGTDGCGFEQPLESVLKAVTPPSESNDLVGGAFHHPSGDLASSLGHGHGNDPVLDATATNASWFRDDSLLAIVVVTDEDDCSASDPRVFDFASSDPQFDDPYDAQQAQTRCVRFERQLVHPVERYVAGLLERRRGRESRLVFAAITGVPPDLTDGPTEGVSNLDEILADARMNVTLQPSERPFMGGPVNVPDSEIAPACQHATPTSPPLTATATLSTSTAVLTGVTFASGAPIAGMGVTGPGLQPGNTVRSVAGAGPYTVTLASRPISAASGVTLTFTLLDVSAVPGRRIVRVAKGLAEVTAESEGANSIVQSICVDDFRPAVRRILHVIQQGLIASCLPRPLIRDGQNIVACDVFVTLPEGRACDDGDLAATYSQDPIDQRVVELDGVRRARCKMRQIPVDPAPDAGSRIPTGVTGWYYDDYSMELVESCAGGTQRIAFAPDSKPPQGSSVNAGCLQPVQDGDLELDIGASCTTGCAFASTESSDAFALRYGLPERGIDVARDFRCETTSNTCQIHCTSDASCPGGYVCYDDGGATAPICVNPVCGQSP